MKKVQDECITCQGSPQEAEVCIAEEDEEDWREPYVAYLTKRTLPDDKGGPQINQKIRKILRHPREIVSKELRAPNANVPGQK